MTQSPLTQVSHELGPPLSVREPWPGKLGHRLGSLPWHGGEHIYAWALDSLRQLSSQFSSTLHTV